MAVCGSGAVDDLKADESFPFNGSWKLKSNENADEYQKSIGINWAKRKILSTIGITMTMAIDPAAGTFTISGKATISPEMKMEGKFGEEIKMMNPQNEEQVRVCKLVGESLVVSVSYTDEKLSIRNDIRTWTRRGDELVLSIKNVGQEKGLTMTQVFVRA